MDAGYLARGCHRAGDEGILSRLNRFDGDVAPVRARCRLSAVSFPTDDKRPVCLALAMRATAVDLNRPRSALRLRDDEPGPRPDIPSASADPKRASGCVRLYASVRAPHKHTGHGGSVIGGFCSTGSAPKARLSGGVVEGFNTKAKLTTRKAFGFRTYHALEVVLHHTLGALPEPQFAHRLC